MLKNRNFLICMCFINKKLGLFFYLLLQGPEDQNTYTSFTTNNQDKTYMNFAAQYSLNYL